MTYLPAATLGMPIDGSHSISRRGSGGVGRTLLYDWTLTRDHDDPGIKATAGSLVSGKITSITNWETWRPPELSSNSPSGLWSNAAQLSGEPWETLLSLLNSEEQKIVHFFSESDKQGILPADAARMWKDAMLPLRHDYNAKLADGPADKEILAAEQYLETRHEQHNLPVIINELASTSRDPNIVRNFMTEVGNWLDAQGWVVEYEFFGVSRESADDLVSPPAQLLGGNGTWTELGKWFVGGYRVSVGEHGRMG
ncbi:hypothetical protein DL764_000638 [Monosporascus ibericus]|uniref:Asl1-like glycosyl hydrolase catalytic domain-containing protein n=1 Tax=Monosporascus ibericus TaxID=155417 RepID=A0A4Q4TSN0_9PEZI|nr:hypothetical protein DL764_000638 [Monosporascus ibericus]